MSTSTKLKLAAALSLAATVLLGVLYAVTACDILLSLAITCGTFAYHLIMRLLVGLIFTLLMRNRANYRARWYRVGEREQAMYKRLGVHKWKRHMPSYDGASFDMKTHRPDEIAQVMCQSELVHETIVALSFLPIAAGHFFGAYPVFVATSVLAAAIDASFAVVQRYNRPRILKLIQMQKKRRG